MIDLVSFATGAGIGGFYHIYKGVLLLIEKLKTLVTQAEIARLEKFNLEVANTLNVILSSSEVQALVAKVNPATEQTPTTTDVITPITAQPGE